MPLLVLLLSTALAGVALALAGGAGPTAMPALADRCGLPAFKARSFLHGFTLCLAFFGLTGSLAQRSSPPHAQAPCEVALLERAKAMPERSHTRSWLVHDGACMRHDAAGGWARRHRREARLASERTSQIERNSQFETHKDLA